MRNFKGFVFTVDSIFALIIASAATSLLLLTSYAPPIQLQGPITGSTSVSLNLLQATVGQEASSIPWATAAIDEWISKQYTWPQYGNNISESSSTYGFGPQYPLILFRYQTVGLINPAPVVADGLVVFSTNGVGSNLYAINATSGALVFNTPDPWGGVFIGAPVIYHGRIYAVDSNGVIEAYSEGGSFVWGTPTPGTRNIFLDVENGYLVANFSFVNPFNGSAIITTPMQQAVYTEGTYFTLAPSTSTSSNLNLYSLFGNSLQLVGTTPIAISSNAYFVPMAASPTTLFLSVDGSAVTFNAYKPSGAKNWGAILASAVQGGGAIFNNITTFKTSNTLYGFTTIGGKQIFATTFPADLYSITPSITPNYVYTETGGNVLSAYNEQSGALVWNKTLQSSLSTLNANTLPADLAIAYGNAYLAVGNVLYAVGTCSADPQSSMLQAIATMYLDDEGACASILLNKSYGSGKIAIMINNSYAPSLDALQISGGNYLYAANATAKNIVNGNISLSVWVYPYANIAANGVIAGIKNEKNADFYIMQVAGTNTLETDFKNSNTLNFQDKTSNNILIPNRWNNIVLVYNNTYLTTYINGVNTGPKSANGVITNTSARFGIGAEVRPAGVSSNFNGVVTNVQLYNTALNATGAYNIYSKGTGGLPIAGAVDWWPLDGDTNDYIGYNYAYNVGTLQFVDGPSMPPGIQNAYEVSRESVPLTIDVDGAYRTYSVSVIGWN